MGELNPKFKQGDRVKFKGDPDRDAGKVLEIFWNSKEGFRYSISSEEVDISQKKIIKGIKSCLEKELVKMKKKKDDK